MFIRLSLFQKNYKLIAIDLSKQKKLDADPKAIQQINFNGNLDRLESSRVFFIIEAAEETDSSKGTVKVLWFYFRFNIKMTQRNTLNVKLSNWSLSKLKSALKK